MQARSVRDLQIALPDLALGELDPVSAPWFGDLAGARVKSGDGDGMRLDGTRLNRSRLEGIDLHAGVWRDVAVTECLFDRVDLSGARLLGLTLKRCHFIGCKLSAAHFAESTLDHVIFEDCRLDRTIFDDVHTTGPVAFVGSVLVGAVLRDCRIRHAVLAGCQLRQVAFSSCDLRGTDLRGNRLAGLSGISSLRGVVIEAAQQSELAEALKRELEMTVRGPAS
jgi:uncharacterized protein YjbI with pentapeptide repeats